MAQEITITSYLRVKGTTANGNQNVDYPNSQPQINRLDMTGKEGPTPGYLLAVATGTGTAVDLSGITGTPKAFRISNFDITNYVELGVEVAAVFHPLLYVGPGQSYGNVLAPGLTAANLRIKADTASCACSFECFGS